jgi:hypothetical protein
MATRMQQRRGTASQWISTNQGNGPILSAGEIGFESDTNKFKIGDGINHWINLTYFTDADSITTALNSIIDGAPAALNTLNELAAALGDDANFLASLATETYVDTAIGNIDALPAQSTNGGKFLTTDGSTASWATVDLTSKQDVVSGVSSTEIGYLDGVTSGIQGQLDNKLESSDLAGYATETYVDTAIGNAEVDQSELAGEGLEWNATTSQFDVGTLTSPTISTGLTLDGTGDFTISADANIILDATTEVYIGSAASGNEVATKSYADAAAAAIVDSAPGTLNTLNELAAAINDDASYAATITTALGNKQDKVSGVSDTEIGYLNGVTSSIQTQLNNLNTKNIVKVASVSNFDAEYSNGVLTFNSPSTLVVGDYTALVGDKILVKDQTDKKQNGIYEVTTAGEVNSYSATVGSVTQWTQAFTYPTMYWLINGNRYNYGDVIAPGDVNNGRINIYYSEGGQYQLNRFWSDVVNFGWVTSSTVTSYSCPTGGTSNGSGLCITSSVNTVLTREIDFDTTPELAGSIFSSTHDGKAYICRSNDTISISSTNIIFNEILDTDTAASGTQTLTNKTLTSPKINENVALTATATEINVLDGITASTAELNILDGATLSTTELNYVDGVTSAIQTQLDAKIAKADITAKGVILVGTGSGTYTAQSVGTNGQVLTANSAQTNGVEWTTISGYSAPTLGSTSIASGATVTTVAGLTLTSPTLNTPTLTLSTTTSTTNGVIGWVQASDKIVVGDGTNAIEFAPSTLLTNAQTGTTYTLALTDKDRMVEISNAGAITLTVPTDASVNFPVGSQINILQTNTGQITVGGSGVTINATPGLKLRARWSSATLIKRGTNLWVLVGDLSA